MSPHLIHAHVCVYMYHHHHFFMNLLGRDEMCLSYDDVLVSKYYDTFFAILKKQTIRYITAVI